MMRKKFNFTRTFGENKREKILLLTPCYDSSINENADITVYVM